MRTLLLLLFLPALAQAQCPDPDSILKVRAGTQIYPRSWEYPFVPWTYPTGSWYVVYVNGPVPIPPVNNDPKQGLRERAAEGNWRIYYPDTTNKTLLAEGHYLHGKKTGIWFWYNMDGELTAEGKYVNGIKTGSWTEYTTYDQEYSRGNYVNGRKEGLWKTFNEGVLVETYTYHLGRCHGMSKNFRDPGEIVHTPYYEGHIHGKQVAYSSDKKIKSISSYKNSILQNQTNYENGKIIYQAFYSNKAQNKKEITYAHGTKTVSTYYLDKLQGWRYLYTNNVLTKKEYFENGTRNGLSYTYTNDGVTLEKTYALYKDDMLNGEFTRHGKRNGVWTIIEKTTYQGNEQNGQAFYLLDNGTRRYWFYNNGKQEGKQYELNIKNDTVYSAFYVNGQREGLEYIKNGDLQVYSHYTRGSMVMQKRYLKDSLVEEHYWRNQHVYDPKTAKVLPGDRLQLDDYDKNGKLRSTRILWPQGTDSLAQTTYYADGKIKSKTLSAKDLPHGENFVLSPKGDTVSYAFYKNNKLHGRHIEYSYYANNQWWYFKSYFENGVRTGPAQLYRVDSVNTDRSKNGSLTLAAEGDFYKGHPMGKWKIFYPGGKINYEGCLCGVENLYGFDPEVKIDAQTLMERYYSCGDYTRYYHNGNIYSTCNGKKYRQYSETGNLVSEGDCGRNWVIAAPTNYGVNFEQIQRTMQNNSSNH